MNTKMLWSISTSKYWILIDTDFSSWIVGTEILCVAPLKMTTMAVVKTFGNRYNIGP